MPRHFTELGRVRRRAVTLTLAPFAGNRRRGRALGGIPVEQLGMQGL